MPFISNVCAVHGKSPVRCKSGYQVHAEPKVSQRASASSRGGVRRKPKAKLRGDEQKPDMRRDASGTSGHVTVKSSICSDGTSTGWDAFCKSGVYARKDSCLTAGDEWACPNWRPPGPERMHLTQRTAVFVTRMHGGVGREGPRGPFLSRLGIKGQSLGALARLATAILETLQP